MVRFFWLFFFYFLGLIGFFDVFCLPLKLLLHVKYQPTFIDIQGVRVIGTIVFRPGLVAGLIQGLSSGF
jgi:hypothetical protein